MLTARFDNLSSKPLGDLECLGDATSFCDESRDIRTRTQITRSFKCLDANTNGYFFNFCDVLLPFHASLFSFILPYTVCAKRSDYPKRQLDLLNLRPLDASPRKSEDSPTRPTCSGLSP
jgi:hypothetical protein